MIRFGQTCAQIAARPAKLEKIAILAGYLQSLSDADLQAAARFFTGSPFAARDERTLGVGWRAIVEAARAVWNIGEGEFATAYRQHGDLGAALGPLLRAPLQGRGTHPLHAGIRVRVTKQAVAREARVSPATLYRFPI